MLKPNRSYKKGGAHRDARTFIIIAEGEREDSYFAFFNEINQRIRIHIVPREANNSAPSHFLHRLARFEESEEYSKKDNDLLWFVLDVDRWERAQIDELIEACKNEEHWNIAISNPCFEVWLHYHFDAPLVDIGENCAALKQTLPNKIAGGYNRNAVCLLIEKAMVNAKNGDTHPKHDFPERMQTKLYKLAQQMIELMGNNWRDS